MTEDFEVEITEAVIDVSKSLQDIANAITPYTAEGNNDATGGYVRSVSEAIMGITAGLCRVADSISDLASAVRDKGAE